MTLEERFNKQQKEIAVLKKHFDVDDAVLQELQVLHSEAWNDPQSTPEDLNASVEAIEARLEDVCIAHHITQESIEQLMD